MLHLVSHWPKAGRPSLGGHKAVRVGLVFQDVPGVWLGILYIKDTNMREMSLILLPNPLQSARDQHTKAYDFPGTPEAAAVAPDS